MKRSSKNWHFVEIDEVYQIHQDIIQQAGTKASVRDFTLLHSAVERPKATFDSQDLYPVVWLKAAALLHSLCQNHPFSDGNKRTAWESTKWMLFLNGYHLRSRSLDAVDFMVAVDNESLGLTQIAQWLKAHSTKTD